MCLLLTVSDVHMRAGHHPAAHTHELGHSATQPQQTWQAALCTVVGSQQELGQPQADDPPVPKHWKTPEHPPPETCLSRRQHPDENPGPGLSRPRAPAGPCQQAAAPAQLTSATARVPGSSPGQLCWAGWACSWRQSSRMTSSPPAAHPLRLPRTRLHVHLAPEQQQQAHDQDVHLLDKGRQGAGHVGDNHAWVQCEDLHCRSGAQPAPHLPHEHHLGQLALHVRLLGSESLRQPEVWVRDPEARGGQQVHRGGDVDNAGAKRGLLRRAPLQCRQQQQREQEVAEVVAAHVRLKPILRLLAPSPHTEDAGVVDKDVQHLALSLPPCCKGPHRGKGGQVQLLDLDLRLGVTAGRGRLLNLRLEILPLGHAAAGQDDFCTPSGQRCCSLRANATGGPGHNDHQAFCRSSNAVNLMEVEHGQLLEEDSPGVHKQAVRVLG
eukprot:CAMPEP_0202893878 /NCGR_PEP_ID=MMETSP1392-20130828/3372_1 /ASSEMBLY_ACC=CAM_ASM_000868 /TAXON_ID=225041 /ORGANISM="Chlamydomonas chlamydogama, Strain SAG 11-48b" /LENGTH=436 /DNA_ID=CAMNT_0049578369 /DNA_START=270 /DNA_END=1581 /DNA_ORIENTATION=+